MSPNKRTLFYVSCSLLISLLILSGGTKVHGAGDKQFKLRVSTPFPPTHHTTRNVMVPLCKEIETESKGKIICELYSSESLGKAKDHPDLALKGIADIVFIIPGYTPGRFPLSTITELPFAYPDAFEQSEATWKIYKSRLFTEYKDFKVLGLANTSRFHIAFRKKEVKSLEDIKGLKIRTPGGYVTKVFEAFGVSPVSMPSVEIYTALERGTIDGYANPYATITTLKLDEITMYINELNLGTLCEALLMNKKTFNELPKDLQKVIEQAGENARKNIPKTFTNEDIVAKERILKKGIQIIVPPPTEAKIIEQTGLKVWGIWIRDMEGKGLPAREIMDSYIDLLPNDLKEKARIAVK